jgi:hypothetical protein
VGRYKALILVSLLTTALGLLLLTNLRPDTPDPLIWVWMLIAGLGIGPTFAVFTLVVQNAVPVRELGTATSSLTLFQQVGGTVGLAITGSMFGSTFLEEVPGQLVSAGVPQQFASSFASGGSAALNQIGGVGDLGASILAQVPEAARAQVEPLIPAIVSGIHEAFSIATTSTFVVGIFTAIIAAVVVVLVMPAGRVGEQDASAHASAPDSPRATVPVTAENE